jgi:transposase
MEDRPVIQPSTSLPVRTIGIDLGDERSAFCVLDSGGEILEEGSVPTNRVAFGDRFGNGPASRVVIEACMHSLWSSRCLSELGHEVIIANPRQMHLISKSERKSDRNDARMLARVGRVDPKLLHPVQQRSEESFVVRTLLASRTLLVATRTRLINHVRAEAKVLGKPLPSCETYVFARRARLHLPEAIRAAVEPLLEVLDQTQERIERYDQEIARLCDEVYPQTRLLRQVTGVGPVISLTYVATIETPSRFSRSRAIGAYLGLTPRSYQSGDRDPQLRISKRGDRELRRLLVSAATYMLRRSSPDCDLKRYGKRVARGNTPRDRNRARVAVARKLAVLLHRLWANGEVYQPLRTATSAA